MKESIQTEINWKQISFFLVMVIVFILLFGNDLGIIVKSNSSIEKQPKTKKEQNSLVLEDQVLMDQVVLPIKWEDLGKQMIEVGVINQEKFESLYNERRGLNEEEKKLLFGTNNGKITINQQNAGLLLNLFWAFGLANENQILTEGPMAEFGASGQAASTGGWTLSADLIADHYSKHAFVILTDQQQKLVEEVSQNIYRPCCNNPVYFPDCNHGMAMLCLLELLASQGASEEEMWDTALVVNSYWFPDTYLTIATYMQSKGIEWKNVNPQEILGKQFSSAQGYANIRSQVTAPSKTQSGGGCGVDTGAPASTQALKQQSGCGV